MAVSSIWEFPKDKKIRLIYYRRFPTIINSVLIYHRKVPEKEIVKDNIFGDFRRLVIYDFQIFGTFRENEVSVLILSGSSEECKKSSLEASLSRASLAANHFIG